jgi:aryl-alcohol dehydrogenase-like predicted oxidoreductase
MTIDIAFPPVILGLWPMAGVSTVGVTDEENRATMAEALRCGIDWFDTAYSYGYHGESDRLLAETITSADSRLHIIGKVAQRYTPDRTRVVDARPDTLRRDAEACLSRLGIECFDLLMLHSVDPNVPIEQSARALRDLQQEGRARQIGVCNVDLLQLQRFAEIVPPAAVQLPLNLLQREILNALVPWCQRNEIAVHVYWVLMKGILAGKISREHRFAAGDSRPHYAIYQGEARERVHRLLDRMQPMAAELQIPVAQLSIGWALSQPGITSALVGARRPSQIRETAGSRPLPAEVVAQLDRWARLCLKRGPTLSR